AFPRYIVKEGSYRALVKIVVVALKFQVADNSIRALVAPIRQENDVVAVEGLRVAAPWLDDDRPVDTGLFLESGVAVVPVGPVLPHREAIDESLARRDAGEAEARPPVHRRGRAHAVPVDRARLAQAIGDGERHGIAFTPAQDRSRDLAVDAGS